MNDKITISQRTVREGVKNGMSMEDFLVKYSCSEDEFISKLYALYKHEKDLPTQLIRQIKANGKKSKKAIPKKGGKKTNPIINPSGVIEEATAKKLDIKTEQKPAPKKPTEKTPLQKLQESEKSLSDKILKVEKDLTEQQRKRRAKENELVNIQKDIDSLLEKARKKGEKFNDVEKEIGVIDNNISANKVSLSSLKATQEEVRQKITEALKIVVLVYANGTIVAENSDLSLDDAGFEKLHAQLIEKEDYEDLRVKDVKILSRVFAIEKNLGSQKVEFIFDNEELETAYKTTPK